MSIRLVGASLAVMLAMAAPAFARTVDCNEDSARLQRVLSRVEGDRTITVKGNCIGNVTIAADGVSLVAGDVGASITGQVEVTAQRASLTGIDITGPEPSDGTTIRAGLYAHDGASVSYADGTIANHTANGVFASRGASITISASHILGNGTARIPNEADGVSVVDSGSVLLGRADAHNDAVADASVEVAGNAARGILAARGGAVRILAGNVHDNGTQAAVASFGGAIGIVGGNFSVPTAAADVILATLGGSIDIQNLSGNGVGTITGTTTVTGANGGVIASDSGSVRVRSATVITTGNRNLNPAVGAFRGGSAHIEGANTIQNTNVAGAGWAIELADSGTLRIDDTSGFPSAPNQIIGAIGVFNLSSLRIADFNAASSITGPISVTINGLLTLQRGTITGDILIASASTIFSAGGPINYTGTITCRGGNAFTNLPNPFNPPQTPVCQPLIPPPPPPQP